MNISVCLIGLTLLFSSIYISFIKRDNSKFSQFMNLLNDEQRETYQTIIYERISIYTIGMILGVLLGLYYLFTNSLFLLTFYGLNNT